MEKLREILEYYNDTYGLQGEDTVDSIMEELLLNNVEVRGDSFYCEPIWKDEVSAYILLAGTKEKADMWVLKKIIKEIRSNKPILTMFNGNSDKLIELSSRFNVKIVSRIDDCSVILFNKE